MKREMNLKRGKMAFRKSMLTILLCVTGLSGLVAQEYSSLTGKVIDNGSSQGLPYASIILFDNANSRMVDGVNSDTGGYFNFRHVVTGNYHLQVSMMGYEKISKEITINKNAHNDAGTLVLQETASNLREVVITGERTKGKSEADNNTYYMTKKIQDISVTGIDVLKQIPGVQIDLQQNIFLEGSQKILILVDGKERDKNFVSQINPQNIDKVQILNAPPSKYEGDVTGVINIILKKEKKNGISGQVNVEIPTTTLMIFDHPSCNLSLVINKLNLYVSYNGELIYGNDHESTSRSFQGADGYVQTKVDQRFRQKYWSHRLDFGLDYDFDKKNQISFYGFYNPFSWSLNGQAIAVASTDTGDIRETRRNNRNMNTATYYSLYGRHILSERGSEISYELNQYHLISESTLSYTDPDTGNLPETLASSSKPEQNTASLKVDCKLVAGDKMSFSLGGKIRYQTMKDLDNDSFHYKESVISAYGGLESKLSRLDWAAGLRFEYSGSEMAGNFHYSDVALLPYANLNVKLASHQNLRLSLSRTVKRPGIFQLDPHVTIEDPFTLSMGNSSLHPEFLTSVFIEYSKNLKTDFLSARLFYNRADDVINKLAFVNDTNITEIRTCNLGRIEQGGVQLSGTFNIGKFLSISPYLRIFDQHTVGNELAKQHEIKNRDQFEYESGLSSVFSFKYDMVLGLYFYYNSPKNNIQDNYHSGAFYFLSFEKTFKKNLKAGVECGLPFTKNFNYRSSEINDPGFQSTYKAEMQLPDLLVMFKISYSFASGKKQEKAMRAREEIEATPRKGL